MIAGGFRPTHGLYSYYLVASHIAPNAKITITPELIALLATDPEPVTVNAEAWVEVLVALDQFGPAAPPSPP